MTDRDCNKCLWATRDGGCASWKCEFVSKNEAHRAWLERDKQVRCETCQYYTEDQYCAKNSRLQYHMEPYWTCQWVPKAKEK